MAIMDIFKKKEIQPEMPAMQVQEVPLSQVVGMQTQGLTNNQIIQMLQRQGYQPTQIYDALAQAETKRGIEPMIQEQPQIQERQTHPASETIVEQIIEEKWQELLKDFGKINEWKELLTSRMDRVEQSMTDVKAELDGLHKAVLSRVGEYDKTLMDVGTEIKAMEKVFQQVLPELTGNVQELSRITKGIKSKTTQS